ncbi:MAG: hypothetical protein ACK40M_04345 [Flavobacteriales bacterium]
MKTTFDIDKKIWNRFSGSALAAAISGDIYKMRRPAGSNLEDIVINNLGLPNQDLQRGIWNVNIFVPNLEVESGSVNDDSIPDTARLEELARLGVDLFDDVQDGDVYYSVQQQQTIFDSETKEHFVNIRIDVITENVK